MKTKIQNAALMLIQQIEAAQTGGNCHRMAAAKDVAYQVLQASRACEKCSCPCGHCFEQMSLVKRFMDGLALRGP